MKLTEEQQNQIQGINTLVKTLKILEDFGVKKSLKFEEIYNLCDKTIDRITKEPELKI